MHVETVVAGFGGQGILFWGRVLATAGMIEGFHVSWYPSYGPEMRGGTANCVVIISDQEIGSTISDHPQVCIVMNEPSMRRYAPTIRPGGLLVVNSSLITQNTKIRIFKSWKFPEMILPVVKLVILEL